MRVISRFFLAILDEITRNSGNSAGLWFELPIDTKKKCWWSGEKKNWWSKWLWKYQSLPHKWQHLNLHFIWKTTRDLAKLYLSRAIDRLIKILYPLETLRVNQGKSPNRSLLATVKLMKHENTYNIQPEETHVLEFGWHRQKEMLPLSHLCPPKSSNPNSPKCWSSNKIQFWWSCTFILLYSKNH